MGLANDLLTEFNTKLDALMGAPILCKFGELAVAENDTAPRVVWTPGEYGGGPAHGPGREPRPLETHQQTFVCRVWGVDFDGAFDLLLKTKAALFLTFGTSHRKGKGAWPKPAHDHHGFLATFPFEVEIPVTDAPLTPVTITSVHGTTGLDGSVEPGPSF